jgi:predicted O-methyltransferase YrrM
MIDRDWVEAGGRSSAATRRASNPLRRLVWRIRRPFVDRLAPASSASEPTQLAKAAREAAAPTVPLFVPPGHFYSPIVDPAALRAANFVVRHEVEDVHAIRCDMDAMLGTFERLSVHFGAIDFPERRSPSHRYYYENEFFSYGDAIILAAWLREFQPQRIIEVGSGFSTAVMLDTLERISGGQDVRLTCIDPNPERLHSLVRPGDEQRVEIIARQVQSVPLQMFAELRAGDLLFLDTTHIVKTGSDVVHELFEILPRLAGGVLIHFHDIAAGFEYSDEWIFQENRSLNESYILRAFLMHNSAYEIVFFNHAFFLRFLEVLREKCPLFLRNCGGSLWLRKI